MRRPACLRSLALVAATLLAGGAGAAEAQDPQVKVRGTPHDFLYGMSFEGSVGTAVGDHGLVLATRDGGQTWTRQPPAAGGLGLLTVTRSQGRCLAGGQQGAILRSDDCQRWETLKPVTDARILGMHMNAQGVAYAVGGFGTVLRSADWGRTWEVLAIDWKAVLGSDAEPHLYGVKVDDEGVATLAGEFELVLRSQDGGARWQVLHRGERALSALATGPGGRLYAVGQEGLVLRSQDDGRTWTAVNTGSHAVLTDVWASPDGALVVAVGVRTVLVSRDGGSSFAPAAAAALRQGVHSTVQGAPDGSGGAGGHAVLIGGSAGAVTRARF